MGAVQKLNIVVLGAGSIGCYLGGYLQAAGASVVFIGRERMKWELDLKGMTLTHFQRRPVHIAREAVDYRLDYEALATADVILVCVKSLDSHSTAELIARHSHHNALVVSFQNGVSNASTIQTVSGHRTLAAVVPFNVTLARRAELHSGTEGDLIIEEDADPRLKTLIKAFRKSGMGAKSVRNIADFQWGKLLINLNNALSALSGGTLRQGLAQKSYRRLLADMMEEGLHVCKGAGFHPKSFGKASIEKSISILRLPNLLFGSVMKSVMKIDENARSSMLDDLEGGRNSEVDFLQGEIVRLARQTGQFAPINTIILERVNAAFAQHQSPKMSGKDMLALLDGIV